MLNLYSMQIKCECGYKAKWTKFDVKSIKRNCWECPACGLLFNPKHIDAQDLVTVVSLDDYALGSVYGTGYS